MHSSDDEEEDAALLSDENSCSVEKLEQSFPLKYKIADESAVTLKKDYILSLCSDRAFTRVAAGLSNASVQIFDINSGRGLAHSSVDCIPAPTRSANVAGSDPVGVCGVRFLDETANCLLIGSTDGLVRLYDLRSQHEEARFEETAEERGGSAAASKTITCFDRNANGRVLCCGTDQWQNNVYLLFYDVRERKAMGGYFESHQDDVTSVRFHEENPDLLCSGSTDGLINVYNIAETSEDDALITTINTESSVHKLNWHKNVYGKDFISCITHTNDFKAYEAEEGDEVVEVERELITKAIKRKNPANCNLIDVHSLADGEAFLLAGTNFNKGEVMRSLRLQHKDLVPLADFDGNKQIVRESLYDPKTQALITAGESGIVTLWSPQAGDEPPASVSSSSGKLKHKKDSKRKAPY